MGLVAAFVVVLFVAIEERYPGETTVRIGILCYRSLCWANQAAKKIKV